MPKMAVFSKTMALVFTSFGISLHKASMRNVYLVPGLRAAEEAASCNNLLGGSVAGGHMKSSIQYKECSEGKGGKKGLSKSYLSWANYHEGCLQSKFRPVRISKKSEPLTSIHIHPLQTICTSKSCFQGCTHWSISVQLCFLSQENKNANAKVDEVLFLRSTVIDQSLKPFLRSHQHVVH